jgi:hypothetical protein
VRAGFIAANIIAVFADLTIKNAQDGAFILSLRRPTDNAVLARHRLSPVRQRPGLRIGLVWT